MVRDRSKDLELAQAAMARRRKRGPAAKSDYRKWMEHHRSWIYDQIETAKISWKGLEDTFWDLGFRTLEGNRIGPGMIRAAWIRIKAQDRMTEMNYKMNRPGNPDRPGSSNTARIGKVQPLGGENFTLKTLGEKPKK